MKIAVQLTDKYNTTLKGIFNDLYYLPLKKYLY